MGEYLVTSIFDVWKNNLPLMSPPIRRPTYWEEKERDYSGQMDDLTRALIEGGKGGEGVRKQ